MAWMVSKSVSPEPNLFWDMSGVMLSWELGVGSWEGAEFHSLTSVVEL